MADIVVTYGLNLVYQILVLVLVVLGLALVFGLLGVMNMAHGEFVMLGAYAMVAAQRMGLSIGWGLPLAVVLCATVGWLAERLLIRPLAARPFDTLLATWGLGILLRKAVEGVYGRGFQNIDHGMNGLTTVLGVAYPSYRLGLMALVLCLMLGLGLWFKRSSAGARVQAMVGNPALAESLGLDTRRLATNTFVIGVVCAGLAGALLAPLSRIEPSMGMDALLSSFFVLVVGGMGSITGLWAGSAVIGGSQVAVGGLLDQSQAYVAMLLISIYFLWRKPQGLVTRG